jgi:hypothetical protein
VWLLATMKGEMKRLALKTSCPCYLIGGGNDTVRYRAFALRAVPPMRSAQGAIGMFAAPIAANALPTETIG